MNDSKNIQQQQQDGEKYHTLQDLLIDTGVLGKIVHDHCD
jgi:hypothetical protein